MLGLGAILGTRPTIGFSHSYSLSFDGTNDYINCGNHVSIRPKAAITVSAWAAASDWDPANPGGGTDHNEYFVGNHAVGGWGLRVDYAGTEANPTTKLTWTIKVSDTGGGSAGYETCTTGEVQDALSGYVHVVGVFTGSAAILYYNGGNAVSQSSAADSTIVYGGWGRTGGSSEGTNARDVDVIIGADAKTSTDGQSGNTTIESFFDGTLDEVAIWDAALDADAVAAIYNSGIPIDLTNDVGNYDNSGDLQGYWRMEEGTGTSARSSSYTDFANTGTISGATFSTTTP